ncbi:hypothetical protein M0R45_001025 [Rubus argutus]|uniref:Uncharacterized protein n=1 Tax=Rubus argutus TaxID=59490 RepID=A0AAW1VJX1_RUBAR
MSRSHHRRHLHCSMLPKPSHGKSRSATAESSPGRDSLQSQDHHRRCLCSASSPLHCHRRHRRRCPRPCLTAAPTVPDRLDHRCCPESLTAATTPP